MLGEMEGESRKKRKQTRGGQAAPTPFPARPYHGHGKGEASPFNVQN